MAFEGRWRAQSYEPRDGDTLEAIAERETEAGRPLSWQELAAYNFGTDDKKEVEALKRDRLGCRFRNADKDLVISTDEPRARSLAVPVRFEGRRSLSVDRLYQLRVKKKDCPKQFLACSSFPAVTFPSKSSFIRPSVAGQLIHLEGLLRRHPESKIMIFGHADRVDDALFNKKLSERRAFSAHAFITKNPEVWETLYQHDGESWGVPVLQEILRDLGHDPGEKSAKLTEDMKRAMREFLGIGPEAPVANDPSFRRSLFLAYMNGKHAIELPEDCFMNPAYMGCGEFNPVFDTEDESEGNRRVTFYFFHPERLPTLPCRFADLKPCESQTVSREHRHKDTFGCSFYDSLACDCKRESIPLRVTLRLLLSTYNPDAKGVLSSEDRFELTSHDGSYQQSKPASEATIYRGRERKIDFEDVKTHHRFTLRHHAGDASWTVFENMAYLDLLDLDLAPAPEPLFEDDLDVSFESANS